ncbi:hypothetical protein I2I11_04890 [Pontibacter sp. 172403-2]|uniref:hypothetical protein n=1 Tax=Pontibacter rufus TaxID=2791028 RepID=UPI0018AFE235|nr:hypothetical protein [Pontibacter sp. 172403-2]MBF9252619.1 hypothetical protein [Pontibacter sp. 172403-2]
MEIASIIAVLIMAVCLLLTVVFLVGYLIKRRKARLRNAAISFATAVLSFGLLLVVEELFFSYNFKNKEEVLVASREAPIGGILLKLYKDNTFEIGGFREVKSSGTYELKADTIFLNATDNPKQNGYVTETSFIIRKGYLEEVEDTGIGFLEVHVNKLK